MKKMQEGETMTVYEAFCRTAQWLNVGLNGEISLEIHKGNDGFFGQQWRLALAIKDKRTSISFRDTVKYLGHNAFVVVA